MTTPMTSTSHASLGLTALLAARVDSLRTVASALDTAAARNSRLVQILCGKLSQVMAWRIVTGLEDSYWLI